MSKNKYFKQKISRKNSFIANFAGLQVRELSQEGGGEVRQIERDAGALLQPDRQGCGCLARPRVTLSLLQSKTYNYIFKKHFLQIEIVNN